MKLILNVGTTGTGKTTRVFEILNKLPNRKKYIYDINNEYTKFNEFKKLLNLSDFENVITKIKESVIVVEEATIFFPNRGYSNNMVNAVVRKRHTMNFFILNFHSLNDVPIYLTKLADYILLSKTFDDYNTVKRKFPPVVVDSYLRVNKNSNRFFYEKIKLI